MVCCVISCSHCCEEKSIRQLTRGDVNLSILFKRMCYLGVDPQGIHQDDDDQNTRPSTTS